MANGFPKEFQGLGDGLGWGGWVRMGGDLMGGMGGDLGDQRDTSAARSTAVHVHVVVRQSCEVPSRAPRSLRPIWGVRVLRGRQAVGGKQKRNQRSMHSLFSASGARKSKHTLPNEREGFALAVGASMQRRRHAGGGNAQRAV